MPDFEGYAVIAVYGMLLMVLQAVVKRLSVYGITTFPMTAFAVSTISVIVPFLADLWVVKALGLVQGGVCGFGSKS